MWVLLLVVIAQKQGFKTVDKYNASVVKLCSGTLLLTGSPSYAPLPDMLIWLHQYEGWCECASVNATISEHTHMAWHSWIYFTVWQKRCGRNYDVMKSIIFIYCLMSGQLVYAISHVFLKLVDIVLHNEFHSYMSKLQTSQLTIQKYKSWNI